MVDLGITRYEIVNPMDRRTTPICQSLNGKVLLVSTARDHLVKLDGANSVSEVKSIKAFASSIPSALTLNDKTDNRSVQSRSRQLGRAGLVVPPFHFRCRSFLDISE